MKEEIIKTCKQMAFEVNQNCQTIKLLNRQNKVLIYDLKELMYALSGQFGLKATLSYEDEKIIININPV
jgi:hypothetical protein